MKNVRLLRGKPLLCWPIAAARASKYVDRVVISTDDAEFAEIARSAGADAPFLRPTELASDTSPSIDFVLHALDALASDGDTYDYLVLLEPTSPLTEASDIDMALENLVARADEADAIVGVTQLVSAHPAFAVRISANGLLRPNAVEQFGALPRRQDIDPMFCLDGSLYISTTAALRQQRAFCHSRTLPHVMPRYKSFEVDDLVDFVCIEAILAQKDIFRFSDASDKIQ